MSPDSAPPADQKVVLVTGATAGIGLAAARELARQGWRVGLVGRNRAKTEELAAGIKRELATPNVDVFVADLSRQAEIRRLAEEVHATYPRLDVLLNNAGAMYDPRAESGDGIEMTWALNHLAYFLLTELLLDRLNATPGARVVSVASDAHRMVPYGIKWADPEFRQGGYFSWRAYGQSKLANVLWTRELARRLRASGATTTANCLHPGVVRSDFFKSGQSVMFFLSRQLVRFTQISPEKGADTAVYLATAPEVASTSGEYFFKRQVRPTTAAGRDDAAARRLWELSESMIRPAVPA